MLEKSLYHRTYVRVKITTFLKYFVSQFLASYMPIDVSKNQSKWENPNLSVFTTWQEIVCMSILSFLSITTEWTFNSSILIPIQKIAWQTKLYSVPTTKITKNQSKWENPNLSVFTTWQEIVCMSILSFLSITTEWTFNSSILIPIQKIA